MSRPALAAARGTFILDFLQSFPERRFSLTEIARATEVNMASCLAILGELVQRGYLSRHATQKTYWMGAVPIVAGAAAMIANPILAQAQVAAERLREELGLPVLLSTRIGEEIVCVFSIRDGAGRTAGLRSGDRVPFVPPIGISFVAWSPPEEADAWIARRAEAGAQQVAQRLRETIALTRKRGFYVTLRLPEKEDITSVLARAASGDPTLNYHREVATFVERLDVEAAQPDILNAEATYDVQLIAAPVIDRDTRTIYNLCLGGFTEPLASAAVENLGRRLTAACLEIMNG